MGAPITLADVTAFVQSMPGVAGAQVISLYFSDASAALDPVLEAQPAHRDPADGTLVPAQIITISNDISVTLVTPDHSGGGST